MATVALVLALVAAAMHATWNLILKDAEDRVSMVALMGLGGALLYLPWALALEGLPRGVWDHLAASAVVHTVYSLALIAAYARADFSVAYPVARGVAPALVAVGGWLFLGDRFGVGESLAIGVIVVALIGLAWAPGAGGGIRWAIFTGVAIATYTVIDAAAVRESGQALVYTVILIAISALLLLPVALRLRGRSGLIAAARARPVALALAAVLNIGAYVLVLIAATEAPVGLVAAVRESSVVIGAIAGVIWLAEPFGRRRIAGAAVVATGVITLGLL